MGPPTENLSSLFEKPDAWKETRSSIQTLHLIDHFLFKTYSDEQLGSWFPMLEKWGVGLGLEVGVLKEWGKSADETLKMQKPKWDRFERLGAKFASFGLDEPLVAAREKEVVDKPDGYAVEETAKFIAYLRTHYPAARVGDIEGYPFIPLADHLWWIDALERRLKEMGVRGLDFYRLDVNWINFNVYAKPGWKWPAQGARTPEFSANLDLAGKGNWGEVLEIEKFCRKRGIAFSLIYWASNYGWLKQFGMADDATWYVGVMNEGYTYASVGGHPDEYVIQSWIGAPSQIVPDSKSFTFTASVRDFVRKIVKPGAPTR